MSRLIIVAGASGAGKSFVLQELHKYRSDIVTVKKVTTRGPRENEPPKEGLDLFFECSDGKIKDCDYSYPYFGNNYGIKKEDINRILYQNKNPILIVANCNTISKIKRDYPNALVIYIQSGLSGEDLKTQLIKYRDPLDVDERMKRHMEGYNDYIRHAPKHIFDYYVTNFYDDSFIQSIEYLLEEELDKDFVATYIFVIMSFDKKYNEVYQAYKLAGKCIQSPKLHIERVSEPKGDYIITEKIEASINRASLIICDVTERSPNVYYELGYARAKNKKVIFTAKRKTELPFDVGHYRTNFYETPLELQEIMIEELHAHYTIT